LQNCACIASQTRQEKTLAKTAAAVPVIGERKGRPHRRSLAKYILTEDSS
jgi:hypothetical protein